MGGKEVAVIMRINQLTGLDAAEKLWVNECYRWYKSQYEACVIKHRKAIRLDICFGVASGVVPILIPFSQTYKDTSVPLFGKSMNVGALISILAVVCSLTATIVHIYQKASKIAES